LVNWKKNLVFVWLSQFLSIMGFAFAMPFVPYYMQELGVTDPLKLKVWVAVFGAAAPLSLAVFAPIWGVIGDRYGRRLMLLRANLGGALFLCMMGTVHSVPALVLIRAMQGVLTGTMTAAQTMVSVHTPNHRSGFALGFLNSGVFSGGMAGAFCGGIFADAFGYRNAFFLASSFLVLASLLIMFGTAEEFAPPPRDERHGRERVRNTLSRLSLLFPLLLLLGLISLLRRFDHVFVPLLVQEIHGSVQGASTRMGALFAVGCAAGLLSGIVMGHLADRMHPARLGKVAALCGGLLMLPQALVRGLPMLFMLRSGMVLCVAGLEPAFQSWLAKNTPSEQRGFVFGWGATVRALGWGMAPLISGLVASGFGTRAIFVVGGTLFLLLAILLPVLIEKAKGIGERTDWD
jgi:DHA1 family multidrug resistance protein-like MFS transporter